jgi:hypothetical protein
MRHPVASRTPQGQRRFRKTLGAAVVGVSLLGLSACNATGSTTVDPNHAGYWLVRVQGTYGNLYAYPAGERPGASQSAYLGASESDVDKYKDSAAKKLGITSINPTILQ